MASCSSACTPSTTKRRKKAARSTPRRIPAAPAPDPQSLVDALRELWVLDVDFVMLVHDNDTTAIKRLREAKQALASQQPEAGMAACACGGRMHTVEG